MCKTSDLNNLDKDSFVPRTVEEHRKMASDWYKADHTERDVLFKQNGVRSSQLLRLPYWDLALST
ncbi:hypothetical protein F5050DRAFT_1579304 [Lentinula boryana]|uniref:Uncharacterized protein n=1 Tax=Lentinula boryana TaxID=40481 RepID=A0ABQ8Q401_9AGAR|nr:hypothetical protein F5050DRAFT_1579304 [Lentinula boryana]